MSKQPVSTIACPCCLTPVQKPTLEIVVTACKLPRQTAAALEAIWRGKGHPVSTERIAEWVWRDDQDGGPSDVAQRKLLKWALWDLRSRLEGSGVGIMSAGYRGGYRLVMGGQVDPEPII